MKHLLLRRRDTEAVMDGSPVAEGSPLDGVDAFLTGMRSEFAAMPAPAPRPTLAATLDGRRELRPASGPVPKPTFPERKPRVGLRPVVAVFATGAVLFGGLATAGALPAPVQRTTADLGSHVGIHLPGGTAVHAGSGNGGAPGRGHRDPHPRPTTGSTPRTSAPRPTTSPSTVPITPRSTVAVPPNLPTVPTLPVPIPRPSLTTGVIPAPSSPLQLKDRLRSELLPKQLTP